MYCQFISHTFVVVKVLHLFRPTSLSSFASADSVLISIYGILNMKVELCSVFVLFQYHF